jgi:predicted N-acetyltransferase YhbS
MAAAYEEGRVLVARQQGSDRIIGVIVWASAGETTVHFGPFAVDPSVKGRGIGRQLLARLDEVALAAKKTDIVIHVVNHRADLFPFYERLGFKSVGTEEFYDTDRLTRPSHFVILQRFIV